MREGNASMYLGSPRMAEMVIGEKVSLEEMGGARMHTSRSGCGHALVASDEEGIEFAQRYLSFFGSNFEQPPPVALPLEPAVSDPIGELIPADENKPFDMRQLIERLVDAGSLLEIHARWAREVIVAYGRLNGQAVGIVANQPKVKGGVLFVDSSDKCARFIATCNAFNVPLLFLADVPGFMIGTQVEREGIIRHGAKMISAVSEATVPKISVIVRKAYGAGLYAMAGRPSIPSAAWRCPAPRSRSWGRRRRSTPCTSTSSRRLRIRRSAPLRPSGCARAYAADIDVLHLASELVVDAVIEPERLRPELIRRFALAAGKERQWPAKRGSVTPV